jgi:hypothetical protein
MTSCWSLPVKPGLKLCRPTMHHILWPAHLQAKRSDDLSHRAQRGDRWGRMTLVRAVAIARVEIDRRRVCMTDRPDSW